MPKKTVRFWGGAPNTHTTVLRRPTMEWVLGVLGPVGVLGVLGPALGTGGTRVLGVPSVFTFLLLLLYCTFS